MQPTYIGDYRVLRRLGEGGMGEVFLVQHPRLPRQDAIKLLSTALSADRQFTARFAREAEILAGLQHPNIVVLYDRGEHDGRLWLAMEYVDGADASQVLRERGPLPAEAVGDIVAGVGGALDAVWQDRGLSHRDVKPANILLAFRDPAAAQRPTAVKLVDFGIAKAVDEASSLTATGTTVGTLAYIAPEAIEARELDNRSDLYSLACAAFELLTGEPPYPGTGVRTLMMAHIGAPIPDPADRLPGVPVTLAPVFRRALAKEPGDRYPTGAEFAAAFRAALAAAPARTVPDPRPGSPSRPAGLPAPHPGSYARTLAVPTDGPPPDPTVPPGPTLPPGPAAPPRTSVESRIPAAAGPGGGSGSWRALWIALGVLALVVLVGVGGYLWLSASGDDRPAEAAAPTTATAAPTTSAPTTTAPAEPTVPGTDSAGFIGSYARCSSSERLLAVMLTEPSRGSGLPAQVVICSGASGPVYRAVQVGDTVGISLAATRTADGYSAENPTASGTGATTYRADMSSGVTVTSPDGSSEFLRWAEIWQR